jgi:hypothetical protein
MYLLLIFFDFLLIPFLAKSYLKLVKIPRRWLAGIFLVVSHDLKRLLPSSSSLKELTMTKEACVKNP